METVFAVAMLLGGPLFGRFGDLFGARSALLVAFTSSLLTYLILGLAHSIPALFLSRLFAFMMHAMHGESTMIYHQCVNHPLITGAQMVMTDVSGSTERADALGKLGVSYGVGMVVGPTVGGYVTSLGASESEGTHLAAGVAAFVCAVAMVIVLIFVPRSTKDPTRIARTESKENKIYGMY